MSGVGVAWRCEADTPSHSDVGIQVGGSEVVGVLGGGVTCRVADGGIAGTDSGERISSFSSSWSRSSSTLFRRRLVFLAGGEWISGEGGGGGAEGGVERVGSGGSAAATGGDGSAGSSHAAVAARPRFRLRQWRRLPAAVSVMAGAGMLHETVKTWHLANVGTALRNQRRL